MATEAGDPLFIFKVGYMCSEGVGTERDLDEAVRMPHVNRRGVPKAMFNMTIMIRERIVKRESKAALSWHGSAVKADSP